MYLVLCDFGRIFARWRVKSFDYYVGYSEGEVGAVVLVVVSGNTPFSEHSSQTQHEHNLNNNTPDTIHSSNNTNTNDSNNMNTNDISSTINGRIANRSNTRCYHQQTH